jgi:hypothetical protein
MSNPQKKPILNTVPQTTQCEQSIKNILSKQQSLACQRNEVFCKDDYQKLSSDLVDKCGAKVICDNALNVVNDHIYSHPIEGLKVKNYVKQICEPHLKGGAKKSSKKNSKKGGAKKSSKKSSNKKSKKNSKKGGAKKSSKKNSKKNSKKGKKY